MSSHLAPCWDVCEEKHLVAERVGVTLTVCHWGSFPLPGCCHVAGSMRPGCSRDSDRLFLLVSGRAERRVSFFPVFGQRLGVGPFLLSCLDD